MKITFAEQDIIDTFPKEVNQLLTELGHPEALVTDESQIRDFLPCIFSGMDKEDKLSALDEEKNILKKIETLIQRPVQTNEFIGNLARELSLSSHKTVH